MTDPILDDTHTDTGGDDDGVSVHISIVHGDSHHGAHVDIASTDPADIAQALLTCLHGTAAMHGPDLQLALMTKLGELA